MGMDIDSGVDFAICRKQAKCCTGPVNICL